MYYLLGKKLIHASNRHSYGKIHNRDNKTNEQLEKQLPI